MNVVTRAEAEAGAMLAQLLQERDLERLIEGQSQELGRPERVDLSAHVVAACDVTHAALLFGYARAGPYTRSLFGTASRRQL